MHGVIINLLKMGILERKERDRKEMREAILSAALKLFVQNGYDNVSIRKIAAEIEYSAATIYLYFEDKDEIFFELHNKGFAEFYARQLSIQNLTDAKARLIAHGAEYIKFAREFPEYYDIMFIAISPARKIKKFENWELGSRTYDLLKLNISQCKETGMFRGYPADVVAFSLWSFVHGVSSLLVRKRLMLINDDIIKTLIEGSLQFIQQTYK